MTKKETPGDSTERSSESLTGSGYRGGRKDVTRATEKRGGYGGSDSGEVPKRPLAPGANVNPEASNSPTVSSPAQNGAQQTTPTPADQSESS